MLLAFHQNVIRLSRQPKLSRLKLSGVVCLVFKEPIQSVPSKRREIIYHESMFIVTGKFFITNVRSRNDQLIQPNREQMRQ
ncbi:hypothetical protein [Alicyclobacillus dauci]|uniref:Uncharacterized protein n=1 Tax=Alicyclobacillus dauci TaxID=1475485 RepID=A0ABY6YZ92_9BACL|nr:hypothetical protein [Alicyclobacillus dauci]WAH35623.1 hypothetical protein NZD86_15250 [Alicyclobacillus dauci]